MNDIVYLKMVDNSRICRPVDLRLSLEMGGWLVMSFLVVGILLFQAWEHVQIRQIGYQIESVRSDSDVIQSENHLLMVERAALRSPQRIDAIACNTLGMARPSQQQVVVLDATHTLGEQPIMAQVQTTDSSMSPKRRAAE
jgi:cell division protein FtsL